MARELLVSQIKHEDGKNLTHSILEYIKVITEKSELVYHSSYVSASHCKKEQFLYNGKKQTSLHYINKQTNKQTNKTSLHLSDAMPDDQTIDMSRCMISPESRSKLEMVILSSLRFLTI